MFSFTRKPPLPNDRLIVRAVSSSPRTIDEEARSIEVTWSTGARVERRDFFTGEQFFEELDLSPRAVRMDGLGNGAPLLDSHRAHSTDGVVGVVEAAEIRDGKGVASVRFAEGTDKADALWNLVRQGILRSVSVGYKVHRWEKRTEDGKRIYRAVDWEPLEISIVPVPADPGARIRADDPLTAIEPRGALSPTEELEIEGLAAVAGHPEWAGQVIERGLDFDNTKAEFVRMRDAQISRTDDIHSVVSPQTQLRGPGDCSDIDAMAEALHQRIDPNAPLSDPARQYSGMSLADAAATILSRAGVSTMGMSGPTMYQRLLGLQTTSDFPDLLAAIANKTLLSAYQTAPAALKAIGRQMTLRDFRDHSLLRVSEAPDLEKVAEHGEITSGGVAESKELIRVETYARRMGLSFKALVNDDLGALANPVRQFAVSAAAKEADLLVDCLVGSGGDGPPMSDGTALFHADHANLETTNTALVVAFIGEARNAMRQQTGLQGRLINVQPAILLVPSALETEAEKVMTEIRAAAVDDVNPFAGRLRVVVEPRLDAHSAASWYLVADPSQFDVLGYAYLDGYAGPSVEMQPGWSVLGAEYRCVLHFGCAPLDWRGIRKMDA